MEQHSAEAGIGLEAVAALYNEQLDVNSKASLPSDCTICGCKFAAKQPEKHDDGYEDLRRSTFIAVFEASLGTQLQTASTNCAVSQKTYLCQVV